MPAHDGYFDQPEIPEGCDDWMILLDGFFTLSTSRSLHSGAIGFIPISEIEAYCRLFEVADVALFVEVIQHLDAIYVKQKNDDLEAKSKAGR